MSARVKSLIAAISLPSALKMGVWAFGAIIPAIIFGFGSATAQTTLTVSQDSTWTVPAGVTQITVKLWGGGGGGGTTNGAGGGGGGGAYTRAILTVVAGQVYTITVGGPGTAGGAGAQSQVVGLAGTVNANGGAGAGNSNGGAAGGISQAVSAPIVAAFAGGAGGGGFPTGANGSRGGGGGGSALTNAVGGVGGTGGTNISGLGGVGTGNGGAGGNPTGLILGQQGFVPGGGGGGSYGGAANTWGSGARGEVRIAFTPAASQLTITTQPSASAASGAAFAQQPVIQLRDASNNEVNQADVVVTAAIASGDGTLGGTLTATTNASGVATFTNLAITGAAGDRTLQFTAAGLATATSNAITITAGTATQLLITEADGTPIASPKLRNLPFNVRVTLADESGNAVSNTGGPTTITLSASGGAVAGELLVALTAPGTPVTAVLPADASSVLVESVLYTGLSAEAGLDVTIAAVGSGTGEASGKSGTSTGISVRDIVLSVVSGDATIVANGTSTTSITVTLTDSSDPAVPQAGQTVRVSTNLGTLLSGETVINDSNNSFVTNASGQVVLTLRSASTIGTATVTALCPGACPATTTVGFVAGAATQLAITTQPSASAASGAAFAQQPVIQLRDASNNEVSQADVVVTAAIATGAGTLGGTLTATTNASGVATFTNLAITGAAGDRTLQFTAPSLTPVTSGTIAITAGAASQLTIQAGHNQTTGVGSTVGVAPSVLVADVSNNPVAGVEVTFAVASGGGSVIGAVSTTNASGVATVGGWTLGETAGTNTLTATITGSDPAIFTTLTATGTAVAPTGLGYAGTAPSVTYGTAGSSATPTLGSSGGAVVTYAITAPAPVPAGITINPSTGVISWSASVNAGTYAMTITASHAGGSTTAAYPLTVAPALVTVMPSAGQTKLLGANDPEFQFTLSSEIGVTGTLSRTAGEAVGGYAFTLGTLTAVSANFVIELAANAPVFTIAAGVPTAPQSLAGEPGDGAAQLTWAAPASDGGSPITGYVVEYLTNGGAWVRLASVSTLGQAVVGLQNERVYRFRVAAVNANGIGAFSTPELELVPRAPVEETPGELPAPEPGQAVEIVNGIANPIVVEVVDSTGVRVRNDDFQISIQASNENGATVGVSPENLVLRLQENGRLRAQGNGFEPGTVVSVWIFSHPTLVGQAFVSVDGEFKADFPVPDGLGIGRHTVQITGIDRKAVRRSASLGVVLEGPEDLRVTVVSSHVEPRIGDVITLEVTVRNAGGSAALAVIVNQVLNDARLRVLEADATKGTVDLERKTWTIGRLEGGETVRLTLRALVILPDAAGGLDE